MSKCRCRVCLFSAKVSRVQAKLNRRDRATIESLLSKWAMAETDATYYRLKLEGKWPGDLVRK